MAKTKQRSAAQKREQIKQQRQQAQSTQTRARSSRKRQARTNPWPIIGAIVVIVVVVVGVFIYLSNQQTTASTQQSTTAFKAVSSIDPQVSSSVGAGSATNNLHPVKAPVLKGADGKPEILYVGGEYCPYCAAQRWGMIAALSRFGSFSSLNPIASSEDNIPTFTFHNSTYTSQYINLVAKETSGQNQSETLDTLTPTEQQIFQTYNTPQYMGSGAAAGSIPFISIANQYVSQGSFYSPTTLQGHSYQDVAQQLKDPNSDIARGIIGSANYLTAAICKVTNNQPSNVCTASPIPAIQSSLSQSSSRITPGGVPQLAIVAGAAAIDARRRA